MILQEEITVIDSIEYKLFISDRGPSLRVRDMDAAADPDPLVDGVVTHINYPTPAQAQEAFEVATKHAREMS